MVKLPNINPTIKIAIVSLNRCETNKTSSKTSVLPKVEAKTIPYDDNAIIFKKDGKKPAPRITKATPKLAPELNPKT
ncbi:hypothetical protein D3C85_1447270 [compost metagenome]